MLKNPNTLVKRGVDNKDAAYSEQTAKHIYQKCVAASIVKNVKVVPHENKFRQPKDTLAQRIAREFVCNFLRKHGCDHTLDLALRESGEFVQELRDTFWLGRKLNLNTDKPLFGQLIDVMGRDPNHKTTSSSHAQDEGPQHIKMRVKKNRKVPDDLLQSSDPNALTRLAESEKQRKLSIPPFDIENVNNKDSKHKSRKDKRKVHEKHRRHESGNNEEITFTALGLEEPKDRFMVPINGRNSYSKKPVLKKADRSDFIQRDDKDTTNIDTCVTPSPQTTKVYSERTEKQSEVPPQHKGSFAERVARLMVPHRYKNLEIQLDKNKDFPTLHTQDFEVLGVQVTEDMSTNTDIDGVSNLLQNYLKNMEGPDRQQMKPARDYTYRVPDKEPTTNITETNNNYTSNTTHNTPEMSSTSGLSSNSTEQTTNTNIESNESTKYTYEAGYYSAYSEDDSGNKEKKKKKSFHRVPKKKAEADLMDSGKLEPDKLDDETTKTKVATYDTEPTTEKANTGPAFRRMKLQCPETAILNTYEEGKTPIPLKKRKKHKTVSTREKTENGSYEYDYTEASYYVEESMYETVNSTNPVDRSTDQIDVQRNTPSDLLPEANNDDEIVVEPLSSTKITSKSSTKSKKKQKKEPAPVGIDLDIGASPVVEAREPARLVTPRSELTAGGESLINTNIESLLLPEEGISFFNKQNNKTDSSPYSNDLGPEEPSEERKRHHVKGQLTSGKLEAELEPKALQPSAEPVPVQTSKDSYSYHSREDSVYDRDCLSIEVEKIDFVPVIEKIKVEEEQSNEISKLTSEGSERATIELEKVKSEKLDEEFKTEHTEDSKQKEQKKPVHREGRIKRKVKKYIDVPNIREEKEEENVILDIQPEEKIEEVKAEKPDVEELHDEQQKIKHKRKVKKFIQPESKIEKDNAEEIEQSTEKVLEEVKQEEPIENEVKQSQTKQVEKKPKKKEEDIKHEEDIPDKDKVDNPDNFIDDNIRRISQPCLYEEIAQKQKMYSVDVMQEVNLEENSGAIEDSSSGFEALDAIEKGNINFEDDRIYDVYIDDDMIDREEIRKNGSFVFEEEQYSSYAQRDTLSTKSYSVRTNVSRKTFGGEESEQLVKRNISSEHSSPPTTNESNGSINGDVVESSGTVSLFGKIRNMIGFGSEESDVKSKTNHTKTSTVSPISSDLNRDILSTAKSEESDMKSFTKETTASTRQPTIVVYSRDYSDYMNSFAKSAKNDESESKSLTKLSEYDNTRPTVIFDLSLSHTRSNDEESEVKSHTIKSKARSDSQTSFESSNTFGKNSSTLSTESHDYHNEIRVMHRARTHDPVKSNFEPNLNESYSTFSSLAEGETEGPTRPNTTKSSTNNINNDTEFSISGSFSNSEEIKTDPSHEKIDISPITTETGKHSDETSPNSFLSNNDQIKSEDDMEEKRHAKTHEPRKKIYKLNEVNDGYSTFSKGKESTTIGPTDTSANSVARKMTKNKRSARSTSPKKLNKFERSETDNSYSTFHRSTATTTSTVGPTRTFQKSTTSFSTSNTFKQNEVSTLEQSSLKRSSDDNETKFSTEHTFTLNTENDESFKTICKKKGSRKRSQDRYPHTHENIKDTGSIMRPENYNQSYSTFNSKSQTISTKPSHTQTTYASTKLSEKTHETNTSKLISKSNGYSTFGCSTETTTFGPTFGKTTAYISSDKDLKTIFSNSDSFQFTPDLSTFPDKQVSYTFTSSKTFNNTTENGTLSTDKNVSETQQPNTAKFSRSDTFTSSVNDSTTLRDSKIIDNEEDRSSLINMKSEVDIIHDHAKPILLSPIKSKKANSYMNNQEKSLGTSVSTPVLYIECDNPSGFTFSNTFMDDTAESETFEISRSRKKRRGRRSIISSQVYHTDESFSTKSKCPITFRESQTLIGLDATTSSPTVTKFSSETFVTSNTFHGTSSVNTTQGPTLANTSTGTPDSLEKQKKNNEVSSQIESFSKTDTFSLGTSDTYTKQDDGKNIPEKSNIISLSRLKSVEENDTFSRSNTFTKDDTTSTETRQENLFTELNSTSKQSDKFSSKKTVTGEVESNAKSNRRKTNDSNSFSKSKTFSQKDDINSPEQTQSISTTNQNIDDHTPVSESKTMGSLDDAFSKSNTFTKDVRIDETSPKHSITNIQEEVIDNTNGVFSKSKTFTKDTITIDTKIDHLQQNDDMFSNTNTFSKDERSVETKTGHSSTKTKSSKQQSDSFSKYNTFSNEGSTKCTRSNYSDPKSVSKYEHLTKNNTVSGSDVYVNSSNNVASTKQDNFEADHHKTNQNKGNNKTFSKSKTFSSEKSTVDTNTISSNVRHDSERKQLIEDNRPFSKSNTFSKDEVVESTVPSRSDANSKIYDNSISKSKEINNNDDKISTMLDPLSIKVNMKTSNIPDEIFSKSDTFTKEKEEDITRPNPNISDASRVEVCTKIFSVSQTFSRDAYTEETTPVHSTTKISKKTDDNYVNSFSKSFTYTNEANVRDTFPDHSTTKSYPRTVERRDDMFSKSNTFTKETTLDQTVTKEHNNTVNTFSQSNTFSKEDNIKSTEPNHSITNIPNQLQEADKNIILSKKDEFTKDNTFTGSKTPLCSKSLTVVSNDIDQSFSKTNTFSNANISKTTILDHSCSHKLPNTFTKSNTFTAEDYIKTTIPDPSTTKSDQTFSKTHTFSKDEAMQQTNTNGFEAKVITKTDETKSEFSKSHTFTKENKVDETKPVHSFTKTSTKSNSFDKSRTFTNEDVEKSTNPVHSVTNGVTKHTFSKSNTFTKDEPSDDTNPDHNSTKTVARRPSEDDAVFSKSCTFTKDEKDAGAVPVPSNPNTVTVEKRSSSENNTQSSISPSGKNVIVEEDDVMPGSSKVDPKKEDDFTKTKTFDVDESTTEKHTAVCPDRKSSSETDSLTRSSGRSKHKKKVKRYVQGASEETSNSGSILTPKMNNLENNN